MKIKTSIFSLIFSFFFISVFSQEIQQFDFSKKAIEERLRRDVYVLAADSFLGREAGTYGELLSRDYISRQFSNIGLSSIFDDGKYVQKFSFIKKSEYQKETFLIINNKKFKPNVDFYPLSQSGSGGDSAAIVNVGYGISAPELDYNDYENLKDLDGKIFLIEVSIPGAYSNNSKFFKYLNITNKISLAIQKGASAIIFANSDENYIYNFRDTITKQIVANTFPIIYITSETRKAIKKNKENIALISVNTDREKFSSYNVVGYIDNNSDKTIVMGAHYDHLGTGGGLSRYKGSPAIHNGADDNATGVAGIIELARYLANAKNMKTNFLFIAFSAEEKGLFGSAHFVKSKEFDLSKVICMLNFDMIGRIDSTKKILTIFGTGSSSIWDSLLTKSNDGKLELKKNASGLSGSDQLSFYLKDIPVLFFFTGIHADYHKPTDDYDKINYRGEVEILNFTEELIKIIDNVDAIPFTKATKGPKDMKSRRKGPSLGVVPDHGFSGKGMRISAVIDERPASIAGIENGDIVVKINDDEISDIMSYMKALSKYQKGDKVKVVVKRGEELIEKEVKF